jgi:hypothetical protein
MYRIWIVLAPHPKLKVLTYSLPYLLVTSYDQDRQLIEGRRISLVTFHRFLP